MSVRADFHNARNRIDQLSTLVYVQRIYVSAREMLRHRTDITRYILKIVAVTTLVHVIHRLADPAHQLTAGAASPVDRASKVHTNELGLPI